MSEGREPTALHTAFRLVALLGFGALSLLAALTLTDALLRLFGLPRIPGFEDVTLVLLTALIASGFPIAVLHDRHIRVDLLGRRLGPRAGRWLDLFAGVLVLSFFLIVTIELALMTWDLHLAGRITPTLRLPTAPGWWLTTFLVALTIPAQIAVLITLRRSPE